MAPHSEKDESNDSGSHYRMTIKLYNVGRSLVSQKVEKHRRKTNIERNNKHQ